MANGCNNMQNYFEFKICVAQKHIKLVANNQKEKFSYCRLGKEKNAYQIADCTRLGPLIIGLITYRF